MATVKKTLVALNDAIDFDIPTDMAMIAGVQYGAGGLGTIELRGSLDGVTYFQLPLTPAAGGAAVTNLAASGIGTSDVSAYEKLRVIKTVAGAGGVDVTLTVNPRGD